MAPTFIRRSNQITQGHPWLPFSCIHAKSLQPCSTLCDPHRRQPTRLPQARILEWVATSFSNAWKWKVKVKSRSPVWLFATPWTAACQAPLFMGFLRQEYWSGLPSPPPGSLHDKGIEPASAKFYHRQNGFNYNFLLCQMADLWVNDNDSQV